MDSQITRCLGQLLSTPHGTHQRNDAHRHQRHDKNGHNRIEHVGDGLHKNLQSLAFGSNAILFQQTREVSSPARQWNEQTEGRCGRIDNIGEHGAGRSETIRHRLHGRAHRQGIQVIIEKNHQTQTPSG